METLVTRHHNKRNLAIIISCFFILLSSLTIINSDKYDINYYIKPWFEHMRLNGVFSMYDHNIPNAISDVDYPPLYLLLSYVSYWLFSHFGVNSISVFSTIQIVTTFAFALLALRKSVKLSLFITLLPAFYINSFIFSQCDVVLTIGMAAMLIFFERGKIKSASIAFAAICLTKLQGCYLLPVYLLLLFNSNHEFKKKIEAICTGGLLGIACWLPFIIHSKDVSLPIRIYLGGAGKYNYLYDNDAPNLYYLICKPFGISVDVNPALYRVLFIVTLITCIAVLLYYYQNTKDMYSSMFLYLFLIFTITVGQRGRYELYVIAPFIAAMYLEKALTRNSRMVLLLIGIATSIYHIESARGSIAIMLMYIFNINIASLFYSIPFNFVPIALFCNIIVSILLIRNQGLQICSTDSVSN